MPSRDVGKVTLGKNSWHRASEHSSVLILTEPLTFLLSAGDVTAVRAPRKTAPLWNPSEEPALAPATLQTDGKRGHGDLREANSPGPVCSPGAGPANISHFYLFDFFKGM